MARLDVRYPETLIEHAPTIFTATPISHCLVQWIYPSMNQPLVGIKALLAVPGIERLRYLSLNYHKAGTAQLLEELRHVQAVGLHHRMNLNIRVPRFTADSRVEKLLEQLARETERSERRFTSGFHYEG